MTNAGPCALQLSSLIMRDFQPRHHVHPPSLRSRGFQADLTVYFTNALYSLTSALKTIFPPVENHANE